MKDQRSVTLEPIPPLWELEWRLVEIACECAHEDRSAVTPDAELVADLGLDCLVVVEFLMAVEEAFNVTLPDNQVPKAFSERATLRMVAEWVRSRWGAGAHDRADWKQPREPAEAACNSGLNDFSFNF